MAPCRALPPRVVVTARGPGTVAPPPAVIGPRRAAVPLWVVAASGLAKRPVTWARPLATVAPRRGLPLLVVSAKRRRLVSLLAWELGQRRCPSLVWGRARWLGLGVRLVVPLCLRRTVAQGGVAGRRLLAVARPRRRRIRALVSALARGTQTVGTATPTRATMLLRRLPEAPVRFGLLPPSVVLLRLRRRKLKASVVNLEPARLKAADAGRTTPPQRIRR